jgi:hypothetical protein
MQPGSPVSRETAPLPPPGEQAPLPAPPPVAGGSGQPADRIARWMERAAAHQTRALIWLRQARDPSAGPLPSTRRRALLVRTLEHLLAARRLLLRAQEATDSADLHRLLDNHLARLAQTISQAEQLLQDLDMAAEG